MDIEKFMYILSIALQISGGFLLVVQVFKNKLEYIIQLRNTNTLTGKNINDIKIPEIKDNLYILYISRIGFIYVFIGYIASIFGDNIYNKIIQTTIILIFAIILSFVSITIAKKLANKKYIEVENEYKNNMPEGTIWLDTSDDN